MPAPRPVGLVDVPALLAGKLESGAITRSEHDIILQHHAEAAADESDGAGPAAVNPRSVTAQIIVASFNMGNQRFKSTEMEHWLDRGRTGADIVAVGLQESWTGLEADVVDQLLVHLCSGDFR